MGKHSNIIAVLNDHEIEHRDLTSNGTILIAMDYDFDDKELRSLIKATRANGLSIVFSKDGKVYIHETEL